MFTNLEAREVTTSGTLESNTFSIKANGKAFKVLIDGLYSDKIRAVIRELWTNAYDSHIAAGNPAPFDCQMPTMLEPEFRVRDYGVSLTHDGVMRLYTTVFESTKEDTNSQVGKLGLGSKSPFAYADTFTVTAWLNGEKRTYSAYIGTDYVPRISLMSREQSDEPQGLEIAFPVKSKDIDAFKTAAKKVLWGFDVRPNIIGQHIDTTPPDVLYEGKGWKIYARQGYEHVGAHAKQGCVVYPLDANAVPSLTSNQRSLMTMDLFVDFPIGDLEISASRESLGYDEPTKANIVKRIGEIEQEIMASFDAEFAKIKTRWQASLWLGEMYQKLPAAIYNVLKLRKWRGEAISDYFYFESKYAVRGGAMVTKFGSDSFRRTNTPRQGSTGNFRVDPRKTVVYVHFTDSEERVVAARERMFQHRLGKGHDCIYVSTRKGRPFLRVLAALGRPTFIDVATLPRPLSKGPTTRTKVKIKELKGYAFHDTECMVEDGGIYIPLEKKEPKLKWGADHTKTEHTCGRVVAKLRELGILEQDDVVYGVPATLRKSVENKDNWFNVFDLANEVLDANYDPAQSARLGRLEMDLAEMRRNKIVGVLFQNAEMIQHKHGPAARLISMYDAWSAEAKSLEGNKQYKELADLMGRFSSSGTESTELSDAIEAFFKAYTLLSFMNDRYAYHYPEATDVTFYINATDEKSLNQWINEVQEAA